ncbi:hypothetical protein K466DRAFT_187605 [Polyporus arcularius HHB13444]|uniref:F-box domain-containing protein n=1 Tax=Polyporus arcularius HHB13444 TaxID=1314778 RepID=A0A5C3PSR7_9APHY|nr:hypothetical protein K466DRAFT_187605 [Polyporus arcularius HHB13444]
MEHLAVELLEHIFTMACTDGGFTGCSLSLVSKHVRAASQTARFHSIALASGSPPQVAQFTACLTTARAESTGTTPRVRHLFLVSAKRTIELQSRPKDEDDTERLKYIADVTELLRIIAPNLYTFCVIHGHRPLSQELHVPFAGIRYPLLREFTLVGSGRIDGSLATGPSPNYPSLTRVHLWFCGLGHTMGVHIRFPQLWTEHAPHVTHLRISNLGYLASDVIHPLNSLALDNCSFPALKRLVVQPAPGPAPGGRCGNPYTAHGRFLGNLQEMRHQAKRPFALVEAGERMSGSDFEGPAIREWLDRVGGGPGCWEFEAFGGEEIPLRSCTPRAGS